MTTEIKGPCAKECGRPAQVYHHKRGVMTPLCFDCFHDGYNAHWRLEPIIAEPPTKPPAPPLGPQDVDEVADRVGWLRGDWINPLGAEGPIPQPKITTVFADLRPMEVQYDYDNQAWIQDGLYVSCAHPESKNCACYGKQHAGERAPSIH